MLFVPAVVQKVAAQVNVRATVSRDKILIGEPISLTVEAYMPLGNTVNWFRLDTLQGFEITETSHLDTIENIDGKKLSQTFTITSFDSGFQYIPPFEVLVNGQPFYTDSVGVNVSFTPFDRNADYRDIKDIIEVINPSVKYVPWIAALLAAGSLAGLIYILRKKKKIVIVNAPTAPQPTPYEEAMSALHALRRRGIAEMGTKAYYSDMNDVLRTYLFREFQITTFERTNEELILQLSGLEIKREAYISLSQSLRMSDFVKFAKYTPSDIENEQNLEAMKESIEMLNKKLARAV